MIKLLHTRLIMIACVFVWILIFCSVASAQESGRVIRIAKLQIDSARLDAYKTMLKEGIEAAIKKEPGVLAYYAVADKKNPTHITILEIYAGQEAYLTHIQTPHFLKYKNGTKDMVKSLELVDVDPVIFISKEK